ncbi:MAG: cytochrome c oxidase accessory protein CcoG [Proteobacteria bacterium]|nr:MAG: cytochrome c oxidase accessory protein CcoG [Pseudomonadota bacterium]
MAKPKTPNLDTLSMLDDKGRRQYVYPADVKGKWSRRKPFAYVALIAFFVTTPWLRINGEPAVLIDIAHRQFFLFGSAFNAQDFFLMFFVVAGIGLSLIVVAALWGRLWCGWACPQTVWLDGVFRRIERLIEGPANKRRRLAKAPWTLNKLWRKGLKHVLYVALAFIIAHVFLSYFTPTDRFLEMMADGPGAHMSTFLWALALTVIIYGNFWWFREQLCIVICPYGRLQSVLQDDDTINVQYDHLRGEPRGKKTDPNAGDCVNCGRCIAVCPTNIDIRNGHQLECIGCAYCIDACDEIMLKLGREPGLIRYDSQCAIEGGRRRFWRPRVFFYIVAGALLLTFATVAMSKNDSFEANLFRQQGAPFLINKQAGVLENNVRLHVVNKRFDEATFTVRADDADVGRVFVPQTEVTLKKFKDHYFPVFIKIPAADYKFGMHVKMLVTDSVDNVTDVIEIEVLGPRGGVAIPAEK